MIPETEPPVTITIELSDKTKLTELLGHLGNIVLQAEPDSMKISFTRPEQPSIDPSEQPSYNEDIVTWMTDEDMSNRNVPVITQPTIEDIERPKRNGKIGLTQRVFTSLLGDRYANEKTMPYKEFFLMSPDEKHIVGLRADRLEELIEILENKRLRPRIFGDDCFDLLKSVHGQLYAKL